MKHLRGGPQYTRQIPDALTQSGAHELATRIRRYWAQRGLYVEVTVEPIGSGFSDDMFQVRSTMSGGLPCLV